MGREFLNNFEQWAESYDLSVNGEDEQYKEVFRNYESILDEVANRSFGTVMEFGVGTGNLTKKILDKGLDVIAIEPSEAMRQKALEKIPNLSIYNGDFLNFPTVKSTINTIVSTYAFHHLTDDEKNLAIKKYSQILKTGDKIVFADTMFENEWERQKIMDEAKELGYLDLLNDLKTEYYTYIPIIREIFEKNGFEIEFIQFNKFVWLVEAIKK
ncbi:SAM-dependent methyltransferase [Vulcanibacillus modesticaldus]|uniref:Uncharacterized methyltransferase BHF71_09610 n=1 Tax=Vulcanibacillus modesticaldus TaxID=337097 RepID=A0A1D2YU67_9BACI|nr:class I SAM-dependent methyltransferase [Vulcanibacillus modesticaldus]OEF99195.1 SAM-dependent methyltransferase [Vulcanibacillus modesticaldus]